MCPESAISERPNTIGVLERGPSQAGFSFARGLVNIGEPMAIPIVRQLKQWVDLEPDQIMIIDAPPGTSCPVVEAVRGADFLLLVTEPTPFGLHDLKLALQIADELSILTGVVINRDGMGDQAVDEFCAQIGVPVLMRIPFDRMVAEGIARGQTLLDVHPEYQLGFESLFSQICSTVGTFL